jgi:hypothetical protein
LGDANQADTILATQPLLQLVEAQPSFKKTALATKVFSQINAVLFPLVLKGQT